VIEVRGINQSYGGSQILWDINLTVSTGSCMCIMGRNGVGKTTLLKCVMGLLAARSGAILANGKELQNKPAHTRARHGIAYVPQGRDIFPLLTVRENLEIGLAGQSSSSREIPHRIFQLFPVLQTMLHRRGGDLSGGQQQQLAIGRALVLAPTIMILDEPNEGIQPNIVSQIAEVITELNREGLTILLVEQKPGFARRVGSEFSLMEKGRIVASGAIGELDDELIDRHLAV
jgi:urea transport system ATP-binding protein